MLLGETGLTPARGQSSLTRSSIHFPSPPHHPTHFVQADGLFVKAGKTAGDFSVCGRERGAGLFACEMVTLTPRGTLPTSGSMGFP